MESVVNSVRFRVRHLDLVHAEPSEPGQQTRGAALRNQKVDIEFRIGLRAATGKFESLQSVADRGIEDPVDQERLAPGGG